VIDWFSSLAAATAVADDLNANRLLPFTPCIAARAPQQEPLMSDTTYQIFQDGQTYKVRITRLGSFAKDAGDFSSFDDAASWVAQDRRLAVIEEQKEPMTSAHLRVV
jgi:hypothetical protein